MTMFYLCLSLLLLADFSPSEIDDSITLTIQFSNLKKGEGTLRMAVYDQEENWFKESVITKNVPINDRSDIEVTVEGLPPGRYAVSVYHDVNNNGKLDQGLFKKPKEPYAFSNGAKKLFGIPSFQKASFLLNEASNVISLTF